MMKQTPARVLCCMMVKVIRVAMHPNAVNAADMTSGKRRVFERLRCWVDACLGRRAFWCKCMCVLCCCCSVNS